VNLPTALMADTEVFGMTISVGWKVASRPPCHALSQRLAFPVSVPDNRSRNGNMLLPANG
jgi:hypothetical protein